MAANSVSAHSKAALNIFINRDPQLGSEETTIDLRNELTVDLLFSNEIIRGPNTLFQILREYSVLKGFKYKRHS